MGGSVWKAHAIQNPYDLKSAHSVAGYDLPHNLSANWVYELPFGQGKSMATGSRPVDDLIGGWKLNGIVPCSRGRLSTSRRIRGSPTRGITTSRQTWWVILPCPHPTPSEWFNTSAFAPPAAYTFGNVGEIRYGATGTKTWTFHFSGTFE